MSRPRSLAFQAARWFEIRRTGVFRIVVHAFARSSRRFCRKHATQHHRNGEALALQRQHFRREPPIGLLAIPHRLVLVHHGRQLRSEGCGRFYSHSRAARALTCTVARRGDQVKMWSGRFRQPLNPEFEHWQRSFAYDRRLLPYELEASRAHARALKNVGVLSAEELASTLFGLDQISEKANQSPEYLDDPDAEDVHHFVEK